MKICLVSQDYPPHTARGGIGTQTWNKAHAFASLGHDVHVLTCAHQPGCDLVSERDAGIMIHRIQPPGQETGREFAIYQESTYTLGFSWHVLRHLSGIAERERFDIVDFPEYGGQGFAFQMDRTPFNWTAIAVQLHAPMALLASHIGWPEPESNFFEVCNSMERFSIRAADRLMACSANIARFVSAYYGVPCSAIDVVHCGVDAVAFSPGEARKNPNAVLFVGNIAGNKGIETVVDAVIQLRPSHPEIVLDIAGDGDKDLIERLRIKSEQSNCSANIRFHAFQGRGQLPTFYQSAAVFCSPAQYEGGVANVYLEAMACGCPVIAGSAGGAPEAIDDGVNGFLVRPGCTGEVAAAIERVLINPALGRRLGENGRRKVENYFAMEKYAVRILHSYETAIQCSHEKRRQAEAAAS